MRQQATVVDRDGLRVLAGEIEGRLRRDHIDVLSASPLEAYLGHFEAWQQPVSYDRLPAAATAVCRAIAAAAGPDAVEDYHKLLLLRLIGQFAERAKRHALPSWLTARFHAYFAMILRDMRKARRPYYHLTNDSFLKDYAVCRLKLWPCGVELLDPWSGVPRRSLIQGGARQLFGALAFFGLETRGFAPFYETHFDPRCAQQFSPQGYQQLYLDVARLLEGAPSIKGLFSGSWWHDPAIAAISPQLGFLNHIPLAGGARLLRAGSDPKTIQLATRLSAERTRLYQEGSYRPTAYFLVWARDALLRWARAEQADGSGARRCCNSVTTSAE